METMRQGKNIKLHLMRQGLVSAGVLLSLLNPAFAQSRDPNAPWWFEVEAIIFKRSFAPSNQGEQYPAQVTPVTLPTQSYISDYLYPDTRFIQQSLPSCSPTPVEFPKQTQKAPTLSVDLMYGSIESYLENKPNHFAIDKQQLTEALNFLRFRDIEQVVANNPIATLHSSVAEGFLTISPDDLGLELTVPYWSPYSAFEAPWQAQLLPRPTEVDVTCYAIADSERLFSDTDEKAHWQSIPVKMDGQDKQLSDVAYILPNEDLQLNDLYRQISRRRGITPMLHIAWRQEVKIGRENAPFYRVMAGKNFNDEFDQDFTALEAHSAFNQAKPAGANSNNQALINAFKSVLQQEHGSAHSSAADAEVNLEQVTHFPDYDLWELDGKLKIFIEYLGSTPYLHVDSLFDFRLPVVKEESANETLHTDVDGTQAAVTHIDRQQPNFLQSFRFDQLRRVISTEIHYFDHPAFGMVLQVRRYRRPTPEELEEYPKVLGN